VPAPRTAAFLIRRFIPTSTSHIVAKRPSVVNRETPKLREFAKMA